MLILKFFMLGFQFLSSMSMDHAEKGHFLVLVFVVVVVKQGS